MAAEYRVDAVIDYSLQFCGLYSTEVTWSNKLYRNKVSPFFMLKAITARKISSS
jgi:benzoyl-CoA reductase/2-hydroxyglutaryl-CoA dehydratase subunit BcrC/BadD/HgdB